MTWHDSSHTGTAIFINKQNLAFALPLILLCAIYAYFKLVPVKIAWSLIAGAIVLYKVTTGMEARAIDKREEKIAQMDSDFLRELAADELLQEEQEKQEASRKKTKAEKMVRKRIAAEKKMEKSNSNSNSNKVGDTHGKNAQGDHQEEEEEDDGDLATFVQKSRVKKKNWWFS